MRLSKDLMEDSVENIVLPYISFEPESCELTVLPLGKFACASQKVYVFAARQALKKWPGYVTNRCEILDSFLS